MQNRFNGKSYVRGNGKAKAYKSEKFEPDGAFDHHSIGMVLQPHEKCSDAQRKAKCRDNGKILSGHRRSRCLQVKPDAGHF